MTTAPGRAARSRELADRLRGGLVVSCQAGVGEPLHGPVHMAAVAQAAVAGGAVGIRAGGPQDVAAIVRATEVPVVGLWKDGHDGVYITPTLEHALAIAEAGAHVVALDGTDRPRPDGRSLAAVIAALHERGVPVMADVSTFEEGVAAAAVGADFVATTLSGYTPYSPHRDGADLELIQRLAEAVAVPVVAEGRIATPAVAADALARGAWCVTVGTAITHPTTITARFVRALADPARAQL